MDKLFRELADEVFLGDIDRLRERLKPLTARERKDLVERFKPFFKAVPSVWEWKSEQSTSFGFSTVETIIRKYDLKNLHQLFVESPEAFGRLEWANQGTKTAPNDVLFFQTSLTPLFFRIRCLQAGLVPRTSVVSAFKRTHKDPFLFDTSQLSTTIGAKTPTLVGSVGGVLLDRPEDWKKEVLLKVLDKIESSIWGSQDGLCRLYVEALERFPEWRDDMLPFARKVMLLDGFHHPDWMDAVDEDMAFAGFEADEMPQGFGNQRIFNLPVLSPTIVDEFVACIAQGRLSRDRALDSALGKLATPIKDHILRAWAEFLKRLEPTDAEKLERQDLYLDLVNAQSGTVVKIGLEEIERQWSADPLLGGRIVPLLGAVLQHQVRGTVLDAFQLLKKLSASDETLFDETLGAVLDALTTPHKKVRDAFFKWLKQNRKKLNAHHLARLSELAEQLRPSERGDLDSWLPRVETAPTDTPSEPATDKDEDDPLSSLLRRFETDAVSERLRRRVEFLKRYVETGAVGELAAEPPDVTHALEINVEPFQSAEELAFKLSECASGPMTVGDFERIADGILRFKDGAQSERISKILAPVTDRADIWSANAGGETNWFRKPRAMHEPLVFRLAVAWQNGGKPPVFKAGSVGKAVENWMGVFHHRAASLLRRLPTMKSRFRLSMPTHATGWLHPERLADRLLDSKPNDVEPTDLTEALYRLPDVPEVRRNAWSRLESWATQADWTTRSALALALGPDETATNALNRFVEHFKKHPPTDFIQYSTAHNPRTQKVSETVLKALREPNNVTFRLFCAALRAKSGLADVRHLVGNIPTDRLGSSSVEPKNPAQSYGRQLLFHPVPVTMELIQSFKANQAQGEVTEYAHLWPYLTAATNWFFMFPQVRELTDGNISVFPPNAQRFFEVGLATFAANRKEKLLWMDGPKNVAAMVAVGGLPHVEIESHIGHTASLLTEQKPEPREVAVELFMTWLADGRATPRVLAEALAEALRTTDKGFKYLDESLVSLSATGRAGQRLVLLALEKTLERGVEGMSPRNLSILLERFVLLLEDTNRAVESPNAEAVLRTLTGANKKNASTDKAKAILARRKPAAQAPVEVEIVSALLA